MLKMFGAKKRDGKKQLIFVSQGFYTKTLGGEKIPVNGSPKSFGVLSLQLSAARQLNKTTAFRAIFCCVPP